MAKAKKKIEGTPIPGRNGNGTLIPAAPGEVRNPAGRGKGRQNNKTIINKWVSALITAKNPLTKADEEMTVLDVMNLALIGKAMKGDHKAYKELMDRLEGRSPQSVVLTGDEGKPVVMDIKGLDTSELNQLLALKKKMQKGDGDK